MGWIRSRRGAERLVPVSACFSLLLISHRCTSFTARAVLSIESLSHNTMLKILAFDLKHSTVMPMPNVGSPLPSKSRDFLPMASYPVRVTAFEAVRYASFSESSHG
ncbi:hypothetical protein E1B28_011803 [Marasmius oreades]|uniref:Secreted protein n=1 Tax=Marasmius oreades TaxID=181124 RepID=A0A9P7USH9_9AGAR|nr:uncharacterized protein E1B28_011803 [Marasmius oreades]KAG7090199.1 hypothetical protein E1B28_011803 [Marasmius oreades]